MPALSPYANATGDGLAKQILAYGARFIGVPYVWGGESPSGFDCSGLVQYVYGKFGITLPRTSQEQAKVGISVAAKDLAPGDLVIMNAGSGPASHVAIYAGDGQILESPRPGKSVRLAPLNYSQVEKGVRLNGVGTPGGEGLSASPGYGVTPASTSSTRTSMQVTPIGIHIPGTPWDIPTPGDVWDGVEGAAASIGRAIMRFAIMTPFVLGGVALVVAGSARAAGWGGGKGGA